MDLANYEGYDKYKVENAVKLPIGEDAREWIANNIYDFHKQICMLYGTINEFCTPERCPKMTVGTKFEYLWSCGTKRESLTRTARDYIRHLLDWVQEQLDDETIFPCNSGQQFPSNYMEICETISRRLLRIFAHIYHNHGQDVKMLKEDAHMNTSLKHFIYFVKEFNLVSAHELDPLEGFCAKLPCSLVSHENLLID